ncbi:HERC4 [Cordylochernes scorpioides]|uniref:HECT-type E3 ubiquitin transferase n=1 Tax=Cordylochernes scorpioides TaxID=51811 RepID=A0ABY6LJ06_9ARAC|nr:HERC4 [Cordylochernes scorpioides]
MCSCSTLRDPGWVSRKEYVDLYVDYVLNRSVQRQFAAFSNGFLKVVESRVLKLFHAQELMALVIGNEEYNWEEFEQLPAAHTLSAVFLTGSDRIPMQGMKTVQCCLMLSIDHPGCVQIVIQPMKVSDRYLPVAHTCFNILDLPAYSSPAVMRERLLQVIQHTQGFGLA